MKRRYAPMMSRSDAGSATVGQLSMMMLLFVSAVHSQTVASGPLSDGSECCGRQLIDSTPRRVVIETGRTLWPDNYRYLRLRACSVDPITVQLWRQVADDTYEFRWQYVFTPTDSHVSRQYVTITLPSDVTITSLDRVGLYGSSGSTLGVPFDVSDTSSLLYSLDVISNSTFRLGQRVQLDSWRWFRTLGSRVNFCTSQDCTGLAPDPAPTPEPCCQVEGALSCDPGPDVTDGLQNQNQYLRQLQQTADRLNNVLKSLVSQKFVTGLCPQGFLSGSYGVSSCYLLFQVPVSMAQAVLSCRGYSAALLTIETAVEDQFIRNFVQNNTLANGQSVTTKFWTTGMYNSASRSWLWYAGTTGGVTVDLTNPDAMLYTNWFNATAPVPTTGDDICMTTNVDRSRATNYWTNEFCSRKYYYICEIPKRCM